jgi:hypothetical protein
MKNSDKNLSVIQNFILHLTHSGEHELDDNYKEEMVFTPEIMYRVAKEYVEEDHVDGKDNPEDHIPTFGAESSFQTEDRAEDFPEQVIIVADFGEEGTQTACSIDSADVKGVNELIEFIKDPYKHKM